MKLGFEMPDLLRVRGTPLQILEYFRIRKHGHAELTNWITGHMNAPDDAIRDSIVHGQLASMGNKCRVFYTTNYDNFLERSFELHGRKARKVAIEPHFAAPNDHCEIVKFHGDWDHPETMVLSESDYEKRLSLQTPMDWRLLSDLLNRAVLFLGYSFNDPNVSYIFSLVNRMFERLPDSLNGRRAYIIVAQPSEFEVALFAARNIEVIPVDRANISGDIAELLGWLQS
jgi:hypothetical protein